MIGIFMILTSLVYIWYILYNIIPEKNNKLKGNYLSFYHSIVSTILSYSYLKNENLYTHKTFVLFSTSYFIWDLIFLMINRDVKNLYMYHHAVSIYLLFLSIQSHSYEYISIFYIGELSNFFNYIMYYLIKKQYSKVIINITNIIQLLWFSYWRVYILLLMGINYFNILFEDSFFILILLWSVYVMGVFWTFGQYKKVSRILVKL